MRLKMSMKIHGSKAVQRASPYTFILSSFLGCFPGGVHWVSVGKQDKSGLLMKLQNLCTRLDQEESFSQRLPLNIEEAKDRLRVLMLRKHPRYRRSDVASVGDLLTPENAMPFFKRHCFPTVLFSNFKKESRYHLV